MLGTVIVYLDYATPVKELRSEAERIIAASPLWDRREWQLQVVDLTSSAMVVRILISAADAPSAWDLRCDVREAVVEYLRTHHPDSLPRVRAEVMWPPAAGDGDYINPARSTPEPEPKRNDADERSRHSPGPSGDQGQSDREQ